MLGQRAARFAITAVLAFVLASVAATAAFFPWDTDPQVDQSNAVRSFYAKVYGGAALNATVKPLSQKEQFYVDTARQAAVAMGVPEKLADFVDRYHLRDKKILEVGAGSGYFQDLVPDYTGLDISPTARRFFHKPFVEASATAMPFPDNSFDAIWTVWVLEHIPNPEQALKEMRRVVKPGGLILHHPAFDCSRFIAQGYAVRPYGDLDWEGKIAKAGVTVVDSWTFKRLYTQQIRLLRSVGARIGSGPSRLHFIRLTPNYDDYWTPDADAVTSITFHEMYLWHTTRGDACLNCPSEARIVMGPLPENYLVIQVHK